MINYEIGERFRYGNVVLKVEPAASLNCDGCFFKGSNCAVIRVAYEIGYCSGNHRADKTSVIFKEVEQ